MTNVCIFQVCLIFGIACASRMEDLRKMTIDNVDDKGDILIITIPDPKTGKMRTFTITNRMCENLDPIAIYRKYLSLRPSHTPHNSLFVFYRLGKCSSQAVGINTFGKIPSLIATFLKLPNAKSYTGHAFRKTSASF